MNYFEQFLQSRNLTEESLIQLFSYEKMYVKNTDEVCNVLHTLDKTCRIGLITDYDVDGLMSGVVGYLGFNIVGFTNVSISRRYVDRGYSFSREDVDNLGDIDVLITADVGVSCYDAIAYAKSKGIYVIVTDHHIPMNGIANNQADIIVDYVLDSNFTDSAIEICGAYTIYQIFERYFELYGSEYSNISEINSDLIKVRHLAAIATVADSMPLIGLNHHIVSEMLKFFNYINPINGSDDIVKSICYNGVLQNVYNNMHTFVNANIDSYYVGFDMIFLDFTFNPILNSVKRMCDDTAIIYNMFFGTASDAEEAADYLVQLNTKRKVLVSELFERMYVERIDQPYRDIIYMTEAPSGILGLLATKVINDTGLPNIVLNREMRFNDELGQWVYEGSIRSPKWYPFFSRVTSSGLAICAGHEYSCGIKVPVGNLSLLYSFICDEIARYGVVKDRPVVKSQLLDSFEVVLDYDENFFDFTPDVERFMYDMHRFAPFGAGFPEPRIMLKFHKQHGDVRLLKDGKHVKITIKPYFDILLWNTDYSEIEVSTDSDFVYLTGSLRTSYFQGEKRINFVATTVLNGSEI